MTLSTVLEHLLISLAAWVVGGAVGGVLGFLIAIKVQTLFTAAPHLRRLSMLLPGRTVGLNLLIAAWTPASVFLVGLGPVSGLLDNSLVILLFTLPFTVSLFLERWYPSPFAIRVIAGLRTLATASIVATAFLGSDDAYGIGWNLWISIANLRYDEFLQVWLVLAVLILILDVLLGIVQLVVADHIEKRQ
jgi:hypothetical protein